ncbi:MAG: PaaI family thioesterase [Piscinibacter sp.]|uniref:PaaI family thioesterase n=1 Tax=Piscinibacter TaxID=1114981 RepID=UPI000FDECB63|nr:MULTISPECIES: PaaI family thioesterase [Piscinibacter]MCW5662395.1 PaaI family thioesterase [Piscinibacter sp.]
MSEATISAEDTLARWRADEQRVRARRQRVGPIPPHELAGLSGLELFQAMFDGRLPAPPIGETLDFLAVHVEHGLAVFQGRPGHAHYNPLGTVHGGWFATLLDSAVGCAVHSTLPAGKAYTTLELKTNIVRALTDRVPLVRAEGRVVHAGNQVATAEGRLVGPDGRLYAHASTTCLVFDARPPR